MSDISKAIQAKSDQLNAADIIGSEPIITIRNVKVLPGDQQPVHIYFDGDNNRPWKPSKGMLRIIALGWGLDSSNWIGKKVQIYNEPSVKYAGQDVGGIRIKGMSHIQKDGLRTIIRMSRNKIEEANVSLIYTKEVSFYPREKFNQNFQKIKESIESGKMTKEQVITHCEKTGKLDDEQISIINSINEKKNEQ